MKNQLLLTCVAAILGAFGAQAAPKFQNVHLIPGNEAIGGKVTLIKNSQRWTADTVYIIDRLTFVEAPAVLTIEPGTIVRMEQKTTGGTSVTDPADVGTLIICRGAKIVANGTAESPILFTNIDDPFVPGGEITIPNKHNNVTNNSSYAPYSSGGTNYNKNDYSGNNRFKYDATCGGLIVLGKTPVGFGAPGASGNISVSLTSGGGGYTSRPGITFSVAGASATAILTPVPLQTGTNNIVSTNRGVYPTSTGPTIKIAADAGAAATATVVMRQISGGTTNDGKYEIDYVDVTSGGTDYTTAPDVTITQPTNAITPGTVSAKAKTQETSVMLITVGNPGGSYTTNNIPEVTIAAPTVGTNRATAKASLAGILSDPTSIPLTSGIGANFIEGFQTIDGALLGSKTSFSGSIYGGSNDSDNSGILRFISIRYGGFILSPNNEINGLTCGAVGRGTLFEFIEVVNNADDDIEHFGGSVDMKYVAGLFGGDDGIDLDQGYRGRIQFAFQIQNNTAAGRPTANIGDCLGEWDGPESPNTSKPYTVHTLFNFTGIGTGNSASAGKGVNYKDNSGGKVFNSIWADARSGLTLTESGTASVSDNATGTTAAHRFASTRTNGGVENLLGVSGSAGEPDAFIRSTSFRQIGATSSVANTLLGVNTNANWGQALTSSNDFRHDLDDFRGIARVATNNSLDPRLKDSSTIRSNGVPARQSGGVRANDSFYTQTTLRGAFRDLNWLAGWSLLSEWGLLSDANTLIPAVRLTRTSGALFVGFNTEAGVEYSIETSSDGKRYYPFKTVVGTGSAANESLGDNTANVLTFVRVLPL